MLAERVKNSAAMVKALLESACLQPPAYEGAGGSASTGGGGKTRSFVLKNGLYITFFVPLPYLDPLLLQLARDENDRYLLGAPRDGETSRSAEKRDWTWVDGEVLVESLSKGCCSSVDEQGRRLHLLPRLAVTLRAHLRYMLTHLRCDLASGDACCAREVLEVEEEREGGCLHLFGIRREAAAHVGAVMEAAACPGCLLRSCPHHTHLRSLLSLLSTPSLPHPPPAAEEEEEGREEEGRGEEGREGREGKAARGERVQAGDSECGNTYTHRVQQVTVYRDRLHLSLSPPPLYLSLSPPPAVLLVSGQCAFAF